MSRSKTINDSLKSSPNANFSRHVKSHSISATNEEGCNNVQFEKVSPSENVKNTDIVAAEIHRDCADSSTEETKVSSKNLGSSIENSIDDSRTNNIAPDNSSEHNNFSSEIDNVVSDVANGNEAQNENGALSESEHANFVSVEDDSKLDQFIQLQH